MAIQFVGGTGAGRAGSTSTASQSLTALSGGIASAPAEGDLVIVAVATASQARNPTCAISGWDTIGTQLNEASQTYDTSLQVSYKFMTSTPDTSVTIPSTGNVADGQSRRVLVFRGVNKTTPFDVAAVSAQGTGTTRFDAAAITPITAGAFIAIFGGGAASASTTVLGAPSGILGWGAYNGADTNDGSAGGGYYDGWTSGSYDPAASTTGGSVNAVNSWAAWTIALRPELTFDTGLAEETDDVPNQYLFTTRADETDKAPLSYVWTGYASETDTALALTVVSGAATVSLEQSAVGGGSAYVTFGATPTEGNLLVVVMSDRSGNSAADATISGSGWTKFVSLDVEIANTSYRRSTVAFWKIAGASEPTTVTISSYGSNANGGGYEFESSGGGEWNLVGVDTNDNGATGAATSLALGASGVSASAGTNLVFGVLAARENADLTADATFASLDLTAAAYYRSATVYEIVNFAGWLQSDTSGTKNSTASVQSTNSGLSGFIAVFTLSSGQTITTGIATETDDVPNQYLFATRANETDTSFSLTRTKVYAVGFASDTSSALPLAITKLFSFTFASETDSSESLSRVKLYSAGLSEETDSAIELSLAQTVPGFHLPLKFFFGLVAGGVTATPALETDVAYSFTFTKLYAYSPAEETDSALQLGKAKATGLAEETDTSLALTATRFYAAGLAEETDSAEALSRVKLYDVALAEETDSAEALSHVKLYDTQLAEETDSAESLARTKIYSVGLAEETDVAFKVSLSARIEYAEETDSAFSLGRVKLYVAELAEESDSALTLAAARVKSVGIAEETDSSQSLSRTKIKAVAFASETDEAFALTAALQVSTGIGLETDEAQSLSRTKIKSYSFASESNTAYDLLRTKFYSVSLSSETDESLSLTRSRLYSYSPSLETDSAYQLGKAKLTGLAQETDVAIAPPVGSASVMPGFYPPRFLTFGAYFATANVDYASETDTAYSLGRVKYRSVGLATETDTAVELGTGAGLPGLYFPLRYLSGMPGGVDYVLTGRADELDSALSLQLIRNPTIFMVRWAQEIPVAYTRSFTKIKSIGFATSTDVALAPTTARSYSTALASETDSAIALSFGIVEGVGFALETDSAFQLVYRKLVSVKIAEETEEALTPRRLLTTTGLALESDEALNLAVSELRSPGIAIGTNSAFALSIAHLRAVQAAQEFDTAIALARQQIRYPGISQSFSTAFALPIRRLYFIARADEVDVAKAPMLVSQIAREFDAALFFEVKRNGVTVYPPTMPDMQRRMWTRFVA